MGSHRVATLAQKMTFQLIPGDSGVALSITVTIPKIVCYGKKARPI